MVTQAHRIIKISLLLILVLLAPLGVSAETEVRKVPVFYVTDRQPVTNKAHPHVNSSKADGTIYGTKRISEKDTISSLRAGIVEIYVPSKDAIKQTDWQAEGLPYRLFIRGMPFFAGSGLFSDMYMVNPDFDAQTFVHYLARCMQKNGMLSAVRGEFLVSGKDKALSVAEGVFGGYTRLGQGSDFTLSAVMSPGLFANVWEGHEHRLGTGTPSSIGANNFETATNVEQLDDKQLEARRIASIARALRVVDVTSLDYGYIGHKIPHEYIAWMHHSNRPPATYELTDAQSEGTNRVAKFFARVCGQKLSKPMVTVLVVTKIDSKNNKKSISTTADTSAESNSTN